MQALLTHLLQQCSDLGQDHGMCHQEHLANASLARHAVSARRQPVMQCGMQLGARSTQHRAWPGLSRVPSCQALIGVGSHLSHKRRKGGESLMRQYCAYIDARSSSCGVYHQSFT